MKVELKVSHLAVATKQDVDPYKLGLYIERFINNLPITTRIDGTKVDCQLRLHVSDVKKV